MSCSWCYHLYFPFYLPGRTWHLSKRMVARGLRSLFSRLFVYKFLAVSNNIWYKSRKESPESVAILLFFLYLCLPPFREKVTTRYSSYNFSKGFSAQFSGSYGSRRIQRQSCFAYCSSYSLASKKEHLPMDAVLKTLFRKGNAFLFSRFIPVRSFRGKYKNSMRQPFAPLHEKCWLINDSGSSFSRLSCLF